MKRILSIAALSLAAPLAAASAQATDTSALAEQAQRLCDEASELLATDPPAAVERFKEGAALYQRAIDSGVDNGGLWFNLGNAYAQAGDDCRAIGAYLQAERLRPGDQQVAANLAHVRSLVPDAGAEAEGSGALGRAASFWQAIPVSVRRLFAVAGWVSFWGVLAVALLLRWPARVPWRVLLGGAAACALAGGITVGIDTYRATAEPPGVVVSDDVVVRKGNGEGFPAALEAPLQRGTEFRVIEQRPGWLRVDIAPGAEGWIRSTDAMVALAPTR